MSEKKKKIIVLATSLAIIALIGGTFAAFRASTEVNQKVGITQLGIEIVRTDTNEVVTGDDAESDITGVIGQEVSLPLAVKSDDGSIDQYVRVTGYRNWFNDDGEKAFDGRDGELLDPAAIEITTLAAGDWIVLEDPDDAERIYLYYRKPLEDNGVTSNFIDSFKISMTGQDSNAYSGYGAKVSFRADSVQTVAGADALLAEWGVEAELDSNGNINSVEEQ